MNFDAPFKTQEPYTIKGKWKIIFLCLFAAFFIFGVLMVINHPEAEFTFFIGSCPYYSGLFLIAIIFFIVFLCLLGEKRNAKYFFTKDGELDLSTPRYYNKLNRPKLLEFFNRGGLDEFAYDGEGNVYLVTTKGDTMTSPVADLTVKYSMDKAGSDWYVYKMIVTDSLGNKIKFTTGSRLLRSPSLMEEEYDDIHMILSTAGTLNESKTSKANRWADKLKGAIDDFDFSNLSYSAVEATVAIGLEASEQNKATANNKVIDFIKAKVYEDHKKKSWFKKAMEYFWLTLLAIYLLAVLVVNIAALPGIFGGGNDKDEEYMNIADDSAENIMAPKPEILEYSDECYNCIFDDGQHFYISLQPETGRGVYQAPSGEIYFLSIEEENSTRTEFLCAATDYYDNPTDIAFYIIANQNSVYGSMLGLDGETTYEFSGERI